MTTTLRLTLEGNTRGVQLPVFIRDLDGGSEREVLASIGVPVRIELEPERYLVETFLPSGELLRRFVDLRKAAHAPVDIALRLPRGHEWLGLQHLLVSPLRLDATPADSPFESLLSVEEEPLLQILQLASPETGFPGDQLLRKTRSERRKRGGLFLTPVGNKGALSHYRRTAHSGARPTLNALLVQLNGERILVPIPGEWMDTRDHREAPLEIVVNSAKNSVSVTVADPRFAPVLAYLAAGHSEWALRSLDRIPLDILYSKMANPFAAAAGGYVLVQSWLSGESEDSGMPWRRWIHNLAKRFPFLPDGAILEGWILLSADTAEEQALAATRFVEAFERGVPLFAAGLRLLLEGLLTFEDERTPLELRPRFEVARRHVRRWATWMDPREPFTTLCLPHDEVG